MTLKERIDSFSRLGEIIKDSLDGPETSFSTDIVRLINEQHLKNPWFTPSSVKMALKAIAEELTSNNLAKWTSMYPDLKADREPLNVAVVMAGNIPLVGFHDLLCVLITGNMVTVKTSSNDSDLMLFVCNLLCGVNSDFRRSIRFTDGPLTNFDAIIATGSDNTSRYFEYYFAKHHHLIRKNRNSVAIVDGSESDVELENLGTDIFSYFGLGCRSVSKVFVPEGYDFARMITNWTSFSTIIDHNKYANNYDYNKAVYLVNKEIFTDTGYLLLKESAQLSSPVAVLYFEYYDSIDTVFQEIRKTDEKIQCIVSKNHIRFGQAQSPSLWDYADRIDTIEFLLKKNNPGII